MSHQVSQCYFIVLVISTYCQRIINRYHPSSMINQRLSMINHYHLLTIHDCSLGYLSISIFVRMQPVIHKRQCPVLPSYI